jgi:hypothetical protein
MDESHMCVFYVDIYVFKRHHGRDIIKNCAFKRLTFDPYTRVKNIPKCILHEKCNQTGQYELYYVAPEYALSADSYAHKCPLLGNNQTVQNLVKDNIQNLIIVTREND